MASHKKQDASSKYHMRRKSFANFRQRSGGDLSSGLTQLKKTPSCFNLSDQLPECLRTKKRPAEPDDNVLLTSFLTDK